jgi:MFS family permease
MPTSRTPAVTEWRTYWTLPVAAALGYFIASSHLFAIGPFIDPLQQEFGWSRARISMGITIVGVVGAIFSVAVGKLVDRVGPRPVGLAGVLLMTSAIALLGTATGGATNWFLLWCGVALGNLGLQATVWTSAVASRFEAARGAAFAFMMSGGSVGAAIIPIFATWLIDSYGWRLAFISLGAIAAALVLPFMFLFFRGAQDKSRTRRAPDTPPEMLPGVSMAEALRSLVFYKLVMASGFFTFTTTGMVVHLVPILKDRGADPQTAAGIVSLVGICSLIGRLGVGFLLDRLSGRLIGASVFCLPIIACVLLFFGGAYPHNQAIAAACCGVTLGAEIDVIAYLASRHFGLKNFGVLFGVIVGALALGIAFGPLAAGAAFDVYGSYAPFLVLTMALMTASSVALLSLPRPPG